YRIAVKLDSTYSIFSLYRLFANQARGEKSVQSADVRPRLHESSRVDHVFQHAVSRNGAIDFEIAVAREKSFDHAFALFGRDAANRVHDRACATHDRRRILEHSRLYRSHSRRIARLEPPLDLRMLPQGPDSRARRI